MKWSWVCRVCKSEYDEESGEGLVNHHRLQNGINPSGLPLKLCGACGNVVDLCPTLRAIDPPSALVSAAGSENSAGN